MKKNLFVFLMITFVALILVPHSVYSSCGYSITPNTTSYDFSDTMAGHKSDTTTLIIQNTSGCGTLTELSVVLSDSTNFKIKSNSCTGSLANSASCQVEIYFEPSAASEYSTSFSLNTLDYNFTDEVTLTGTGVAASASDNTALLVAAAKQSQDDSDGCSATAATGTAGKKAYGPAALGLVAMLGLVMATVAVRRRARKRD